MPKAHFLKDCRVFVAGLLATLRSRPLLQRAMPKPHFVRDYRAFVSGLLATHSYERAMEIAVGGDFEETGRSELEVLLAAGLKEGHSVVDVGCGSGRTAAQLGRRFSNLDYLGIDVVPQLLKHAAAVSPRNYHFQIAPGLTIPKPDASADLIYFFSVFTHLKHEESYRYLLDARRALKPDGRIVFSFLESQKHWPIFQGMVDAGINPSGPLIMLIERPMIEEWARRLALEIVDCDLPAFGQSLVALAHR